MAQTKWERKRLSVRSLLLDEKNPRLGIGSTARSPREIIQLVLPRFRGRTRAWNLSDS